MTKRINILLLCILFSIFCGACSNEGGGTSISNPPTIPTVSLLPDFDENIFQTTLTDSSAATSLSYLTDPSTIWSNVVINGPFSIAMTNLAELEIWGETVAALIAADTDFSLSSEPTSYLVEDVSIAGVTKTWAVSVSLRDDEFIQVVIYNSTNSKIWAYYLFQTDSDGSPIVGIFSFVHPEKLNDTAASGIRFMGLSFDVSDSASTRMSFTADIYNSTSGHYIVPNLTYECDTDTKDCVSEILIIESEPPTREFAEHSIRLSWNDTTQNVCMSTVTYNTGAELGQTSLFTGGQLIEDSDITAEECTVATPFWSERTSTVDDLPDRYSDDTSTNGFASELYGTGDSVANWQSQIDSIVQESWLMGEFY